MHVPPRVESAEAPLRDIVPKYRGGIALSVPVYIDASSGSAAKIVSLA